MEGKIEIDADEDFSWTVINDIELSFLSGSKVPELYRLLEGSTKRGMELKEISEVIEGCHVFAASVLDNRLKEFGIRVANTRGVSTTEVRKMLRENPRYPGQTFYTDAPALILRSERDDSESNKILIKQLLPLIEEKEGKIKPPYLILGLDYKPSGDKRGYRLVPVAGKEFRAVHDDRLEGRYSLSKYFNVDSLGLPIFDNGGHRTYYARGKGLSAFGWDNSLFTERENLLWSNERGRIVLIKTAS